MSSWQLMLNNFELIAILMAALWVVSLSTRNVAIVDIFWGLGYAVIAWMSWWWTGSTGMRQLLLVGMTTLWGLRLAVYLARRNWGRPEDHRYAAMRLRHARHFAMFSALWIFGLQGLLMWSIATRFGCRVVREGHLRTAAGVRDIYPPNECVRALATPFRCGSLRLMLVDEAKRPANATVRGLASMDRAGNARPIDTECTAIGTAFRSVQAFEYNGRWTTDIPFPDPPYRHFRHTGPPGHLVETHLRTMGQ